MVEVGAAQILLGNKGDDRYLVRVIEDEKLYLLAVADGLSLNNGRAAAQWVIDFLKRTSIIANPREMLRALRSELASVRGEFEESATTLTCGLLSEQEIGAELILRFDYFAVGDSPIWTLVKGDEKHPYRRNLVHGPPHPAERGRVYATVRLHTGDVDGPVTFGAIELSAHEVLVVCSDGIPEREVFFPDRNLLDSESVARMDLCHMLFDWPPYTDDGLAEVLKAYDRGNVLFDDTTIIAARLAMSWHRDGDDYAGLTSNSIELVEPRLEVSEGAGSDAILAQAPSAGYEGERETWTVVEESEASGSTRDDLDGGLSLNVEVRVPVADGPGRFGSSADNAEDRARFLSERESADDTGVVNEQSAEIPKSESAAKPRRHSKKRTRDK